MNTTLLLQLTLLAAGLRDVQLITKWKVANLFRCSFSLLSENFDRFEELRRRSSKFEASSDVKCFYTLSVELQWDFYHSNKRLSITTCGCQTWLSKTTYSLNTTVFEWKCIDISIRKKLKCQQHLKEQMSCRIVSFIAFFTALIFQQ